MDRPDTSFPHHTSNIFIFLHFVRFWIFLTKVSWETVPATSASIASQTSHPRLHTTGSYILQPLCHITCHTKPFWQNAFPRPSPWSTPFSYILFLLVSLTLFNSLPAIVHTQNLSKHRSNHIPFSNFAVIPTDSSKCLLPLSFPSLVHLLGQHVVQGRTSLPYTSHTVRSSSRFHLLPCYLPQVKDE